MANETKRDGGSGEVFFEFTQIGNQMGVAAIDAATSTEVVVIAPLVSSRLQMQKIALAKLERKLGRTPDHANSPPDPKPEPGSGVRKTV